MLPDSIVRQIIQALETIKKLSQGRGEIRLAVRNGEIKYISAEVDIRDDEKES